MWENVKWGHCIKIKKAKTKNVSRFNNSEVKKEKKCFNTQRYCFSCTKKWGWEDYTERNGYQKLPKVGKSYRKRQHKINVGTLGIQILDP